MVQSSPFDQRADLSPSKAYLIQLMGFIIRLYQQRLGSPISTLSTIFIPFVFALALSICLWTTPSELIPTTWYGEGTTNENTTMNVTTIVQYSFCRHPQSAYQNINWQVCAAPDEELFCLPNVATGRDVCLPIEKKATVSGLLYSMYYGSGALTLNAMDAHLTLSAYAALEREEADPTYFGRGGRESLTHFGSLLVASDDSALAAEFMNFCRAESDMCKIVLHDEAFSSLEAAHDYALAHSNTVWATVYLPSKIIRETEKSHPFTIQMNYTATPWTFKDQVQHLFSKPAVGSDGYVLYWTSGFMTLQVFVQQFFLEKQLSEKASMIVGPASYDHMVPMLGMSTYVNQWGYAVVPMPTPERSENPFLTTWGYYLPLICSLGALFPVAHLTGLIVEEKPSGIREAMLIMGMRQSGMFIGWYLSSIPLDATVALLISLVFKLGLLHQVSFSILFLLYFTFLQQNTALSLLLSTLFSNPRMASWCGALLIFIFAMPYYTFPPGMSDAVRWGTSTVPCVGLSNAIGMLVSFVSVEHHVGWSLAREGAFSVVDALGMMWASFAFLMLVAFYSDMVYPSSVGRREHPLFFLFWLIRRLRGPAAESASPISLYLDEAEEEEARELLQSKLDPCEPPHSATPAASAPEHLRLVEHYDEVVRPNDPNIPVIFKDVSMAYVTGSLLGFLYTFFTGLFRRGDYRVALCKVSFALHRGEVTALLGPNGAGKTTVMNLATSMRQPSSGKIYIAGHDAEQNFTACRRHIGYCPQENIIWEGLSVEAHFSFYARMKGLVSTEKGLLDVEDVVEEILMLSGLQHQRSTLAQHLSGGEKRRLCVGLALLGRPAVLFLDEPTSGLDVKGRREVYEIIQRVRKGCSVLISTHLLEEADRLADRLLLLRNGELCGEGTPMFLKKMTNVGYKLTCVMEGKSKMEELEEGEGSSESSESDQLNELIEFVRLQGEKEGHHSHLRDATEVQAVPPDCPLLGIERRGREITFMFPLPFFTSGVGKRLLQQLHRHQKELRVRSLGISLTTLEDVFKTATMGEVGFTASSGEGSSLMQCPFAAEEVRTEDGTCPIGLVVGGEEDKNDENRSETRCRGFCRDFSSYFLKRLHFAKRDGRLVLFQILLPMLFLAVGLLINLAQSPMQPAITLDMTSYPSFADHPSEVLVTTSGSFPDPFMLSTSTVPDSAFGQYLMGNLLTPTPGSTMAVSQLNEELSAGALNHGDTPRYVALGLSSMVIQSGPPVFTNVIMHNMTYSHAAPQGIDVMYHLAYHQLFGDNPSISRPVVRNAPMYLGPYEKMLVETNKQVIIGMFVILPFVLIPANTISYIVREKASGARHLQWLTGASMAAYWCSSFVFDALCYLVSILIAFIIFFTFNRTEYVGEGFLWPSVSLFVLFGISSVPVSYCLSFFFDSPFKAQNIVLMVNFVFGFLWVTMESLLADSAFEFVMWGTRILRVMPSVSFGEGLYVLAGTNLGWLMYPDKAGGNLFALLRFEKDQRSIFQGGIGTGLIYMGSVFVASSLLLLILEYGNLRRWKSCSVDTKDLSSQAGEEPESVDKDPSVEFEEARVCSETRGPSGDAIVIQHLTKSYNGRDVVDDVSFGVVRGEVMGLLGLNGAGKTTTLSILSGQREASSGGVYMNRHSIKDRKSRPCIGYCPQFDALLDQLTPVEHLYLYARLRGMEERLVEGEVSQLIQQLGLHPHRDQTAAALSGGNRRRLSLGIALVGRTTSVLLDEPTAGMDAFARTQTCEAIQRLTKDKSVLLTTHLFGEIEALADRIAILSHGQLRTIGTAQELKSKHSQFHGGMHLMDIHFQSDIDASEEKKDAVVSALQAFVTSLGGACEANEMKGCGLRLVIRSIPLPDICDIMCALNDNEIEGVPSVAYVSVTQPMIDDVLLSIS